MVQGLGDMLGVLPGEPAGRLLTALRGDRDIVNCVAGHPERAYSGQLRPGQQRQALGALLRRSVLGPCNMTLAQQPGKSLPAKARVRERQ